jgi:glutaredoxin
MITSCQQVCAKINQYKDKKIYLVFYSQWCGYSKKALALLESTKTDAKCYIVDKILGSREKLLSCLISDAENTSFDKNHKTVPIIFYQGKFLGGYTELSNKLNAK